MTIAYRKSVPMITYSEEIVDGEPIYVSSNCLPVKALRHEPAGHSFHAAALRLIGHCVEVDTDDDDGKDAASEKEHVYVESWDSYSSKSKKKSGSEAKQQDHYALLGLSHLRYLATEDQIRKSYREAALRHHPDKQAALLLAEETEASKQAKKDEIENHFKAIQEAYEVLIDPAKRRIYDSTDEFDDEIPHDCAPQDFFKVFGPAFMRNGRWSVTQPIPSLGDDKTPIEEVDKFYNFWYVFKSWREFPHADEFDVEQAEGRDHRRWMEKQNAKLSEKARKEEYARIRTLVDNAYKRDPRIQRRKEEAKAEKKRAKEAKILAKKMQQEEAARIAEEERKRKEEESKRAAEAASVQKKLKEKEKKLARKERSRLKKLSTSVVSQCLLDLNDDDVESLCTSLDREQLQNLCDQLERKEDHLERAKLLKEKLESNQKAKEKEKEKEKAEDEKSTKQNGFVHINGLATAAANNSEKPWSKEEIELLRKGMQKYPRGTSRRWEVISEYIGTGRSVEEITKATKSVLLQKPDSAKAFDSFLEKRKPAQAIASPLTTRDDVQGSVTTTASSEENSDGTGTGTDEDWSGAQEKALVQALKTFPKETAQRWERVAEAVPGKTVAQCKKKFTTMKESFRNTANRNNNDSQEEGSGSATASVPSTTPSSSSCSEEDAWSDVQGKALLQALKSFPKDTNQRWERVAEAVPGKTVIQCKKKFASLKEDFRNKKSAV
ncbi:uncharacterized protein LOC127263065 [Andrographis paniculata]|uniref:uncharacterized protein LOC127263065 n=1 Tax=Andrographis paniculata TaxID=175694 RepID=UPI0021E88360|nr:uncharacterized protein LOC127263065 [Andrographis paniculata]